MRALLPLGAAFLLPANASIAIPAADRYAFLAAPAAESPAASAPANGAGASADREAILALARDGLLDSARAAASRALANRPDDAFLLLLLGKLSSAGQESADYFKRALKAGGTSPEAEEALFRLGQYTYATGKYYLAIPYFRDYLRQYANGGWKEPALYWMGNACLALTRSRGDRMNYLDSAAAWFQKLQAETRPSDYYHALALEGMAKAKAGRGDREGAWQAVQEALEKAPDEERPPLLLLAAQIRQGIDRAAEKSLLSQLISKYPQSPEARYLRRLNAETDTARWKSGPGLPRAIPPATQPSARDSAAKPAEAAGNADNGNAAGSAPSVQAAGASRPAQPDAAKPYTLQCGAYTQAANAQAMLATLSKLGLAPEIVERERGGKRIYQVRVGRFASEAEAEGFALERLKPQRILSQPVLAGP